MRKRLRCVTVHRDDRAGNSAREPPGERARKQAFDDTLLAASADDHKAGPGPIVSQNLGDRSERDNMVKQQVTVLKSAAHEFGDSSSSRIALAG